MPSNIKRKHSASFKTKVVLELIKEIEPISQICSRYEIHPTQARRWKEQAISSLTSIFDSKVRNAELKEKNLLIDQLYKNLGKKEIELDWLKKKMESVK